MSHAKSFITDAYEFLRRNQAIRPFERKRRLEPAAAFNDLFDALVDQTSADGSAHAAAVAAISQCVLVSRDAAQQFDALRPDVALAGHLVEIEDLPEAVGAGLTLIHRDVVEALQFGVGDLAAPPFVSDDPIALQSAFTSALPMVGSAAVVCYDLLRSSDGKQLEAVRHARSIVDLRLWKPNSTDFAVSNQCEFIVENAHGEAHRYRLGHNEASRLISFVTVALWILRSG